MVDFRKGHETDLSEVLQSERIFVNVSKGQFAKSSDLQAAFGTTDTVAIAQQILLDEKASLQVSDKEREQLQENTLAQIATWISKHCVHPQTLRPYTVAQLQQALASGYVVQTHKPIKKQCLDATKFLMQNRILDIQRAKMELLLTIPVVVVGGGDDALDDDDANLQESLEQMDPSVTILVNELSKNNGQDETSAATSWRHVRLQADPSCFRPIDELAQRVGGRLEILQQVVMSNQGDVSMEEDLIHRKQDNHQNRRDQSHTVTSSNRTTGSNTVVVDEDEIAPILNQLQAIRIQAAAGEISGKMDDDNNNDENDEEDELLLPLTRKEQRQKQKKKAKSNAVKSQQLDKNASPSFVDTETQVANVPVNHDDHDDDIIMTTTITTAATNDAGKRCNTCGGSFATATEHRAHYKSDWHLFNQKLKLKGVPAVSEQEFQLCDQDAFFR